MKTKLKYALWLAITIAVWLTALGQPNFPDNCIQDTTIWTAPDSAVELQLKVSVFSDTLLYRIQVTQGAGLQFSEPKIDTVTGHATVSWFDAIAQTTAIKKGIEP